MNYYRFGLMLTVFATGCAIAVGSTRLELQQQEIHALRDRLNTLQSALEAQQKSIQKLERIYWLEVTDAR